MRVGFWGIGRMGVHMATHIHNAGFDLVVGNRTPERCAPLERLGAHVEASSPAALARGADVVVTALADCEAAIEVYLGPEGILAGIGEGAVVMDMSTVGPSCWKRIAAAAHEHGATPLDAPVSGSIPAAESASLTVMVGGDREAFERVRPLLASMSRQQFFLGAEGSAAAMKLAVNNVIGATNLALSEALVLAERSGIAREDAYEVLLNSAITSPFMQYKQDAFLDPDGAEAFFTTRLLQKDIRLALELGREVTVPLFGAGAVHEAFNLAIGLGNGDQDVNRMADALRDVSGDEDRR
jgi:3-hydroxyisobutyrate dehydrogenase-like beta-hydroxyacid dehydrogenase